jgi:flagellar transcriptional activator FlhD
MLDDEILNAILEQNLSYLLLAQKLLAEDRKMAMFRLHYDGATADLVASLTTGQMMRLAGSGQLLCSPSLLDAAKLKALLCNERSANLVQMHTAMMLASTSKTVELSKVTG